MACDFIGFIIKIRRDRRRRKSDKSTRKETEKAIPPLRKVQIRHGRVVSWSSANKSVARGISRHATPRAIASRRSSAVSLPMTVDLEREIENFRRDYALAKEREAREPGSARSANGLYPIKEMEMLPAITQSRYMSFADQAEDPVDLLKESSWETYNSHRPSNHALSSCLGSVSPALENALKESPATSPTSPSGTTPKPTTWPSVPKRTSRSAALQPLHIQKPTQTMLTAQSPKSEVASPTSPPYAPSIQSAIYKSPIQDIIPAAPQPRKPSQLNLRGSFSRLELSIPSPVTFTSTVTSPATPHAGSIYSTRATVGRSTPRVSRYSSISLTADSVDCQELEPVRRHPRSGRSRTTSNARSISRSRRSRSRSASHRVRKRPPPLSLAIEPVPYPKGFKVALSADDQGLYTSVFPASPTVSESGTPQSPPAADASKLKQSNRTVTPQDSSPAFAVTPAFRVPLYGDQNGPAITIESLRQTGDEADTADLERRGSDGDVVQKSKKVIKEQERPSVLRTYSHHGADSRKAAWPPADLQSMLVQAHGMAQTTAPITSKPASSSLPPPRRTSLKTSRSHFASLLHVKSESNKSSARPKHLLHNISSSFLHDNSKPSTKPNRHSNSQNSPPTSNSSAVHSTAKRPSLDEKALPPLPPQSPATPPGVQRVVVDALRVEHPDEPSPREGRSHSSEIPRANPRRSISAALRTSSSHPMLSSLPSTQQQLEQQRSSQVRSEQRRNAAAAEHHLARPAPAKRSASTNSPLRPTTTAQTSAPPPRTPDCKRHSGLSMIAIAAAGSPTKSRVTTVTHREVHGLSSSSDDDYYYEASPKVSAMSTPSGKGLRYSARSGQRQARRWEIVSAVSPLSADFPAYVKA